MDEQQSGRKRVEDRVAKGDDVIPAVRHVVDESLRKIRGAVKVSRRELDEAEKLYEEAEGKKRSESD